MKRNFDDLKLLDAALSDESWEGCSARLRSEGLATLRATKRMRRRGAIGGQIAAMITIIAGLWFSLSGTKAPIGNRGRNIASAAGMPGTQVPDQDQKESYITEEQMLAMFPKGSCVLAEINGQKQLVVFGEQQMTGASEVGEQRRASKISNSKLEAPGKS